MTYRKDTKTVFYRSKMNPNLKRNLTLFPCPGLDSYIDQGAVIKKILQHRGLWEESHAPPDRGPPEREITFDPSYGSINSPSRSFDPEALDGGRSRDSQLM